MASFFPLEFIGIFITFYVTYKLKFQKYIISFLFRTQVVYLPLTDKDFKDLMKLAKENKENKKQDKFLIRSCQFNEYCEVTKSRKYLDFDFLVFIYFCNFIVYVFNTLQKIFRIVIIGKEKSPFLINETKNNENNDEETIKELNISIYLSLSFILYIIYRELSKYVFVSGLFSRPAKEFYLSFIFCFSIFFVNEYYNENLFKLNYESACKIVNKRIDLILTQAKTNINIDISKKHLKIFFSILFALISSIFLRCSQRGAYFDNFFCNVSKTSQFTVSNNHSYNSERAYHKEMKVEYIPKIKSIIYIIIIAILLNPLLDNFLEIININNDNKKFVIIFTLLNIDFISGLFDMWYAYFMFSVENYKEIMKFVTRPNQEYLKYHQNTINYINENAWDVLSHLFMNCFLPFYIFLCYLNEINIIENYDKENNDGFNNGFVDNIFYVVFLGIIFSKGIFENGIFYFRLITKEKHLILY